MENLKTSSLGITLFDILSDYLIECIEHIDTFISKEKKKEEIKCNDMFQNITSEEKEKYLNYSDIYSSLTESIDKWDIFIQIIRESIFIKAFSQFEYSLDMFCKENRNRTQTILMLKDISEKGIDRSTTYLKKVIGLDFPAKGEFNEVWKNINKYKSIRNKIVHNDGLLRPDDKETEELKIFFDKIKCFSLDKTNHIKIHRSFIYQVTGDFKFILNNLESQIN